MIKNVPVEGRLSCKSNGRSKAFLYLVENTKTGLRYSALWAKKGGHVT